MRSVVLFVALSFMLWCLGGFYYIYTTESYKITNRSPTDAIVVYTGGNQRINTGISLLKAGYAPIMFISGVSSPTQLKNFLAENGIAQDQVIYGLSANTTQDNAEEIAEFISAHNLKSIRLVTSSYHMPRALDETESRVRLGTIIIPHPVLSEQRNYKILFREYNKYILSKLLKYFR
jgi:uncharacterized SAM-binding protein YcdF (DUF218 family)